MVQNKQRVLESGLFLPEKIHNRMSEVKVINWRATAYKNQEQDVIPNEEFSRWKYWYDNMLNDIAVSAALHKQASNVMHTGYRNYIHDFKQNDKTDAESKFNEMHE